MYLLFNIMSLSKVLENCVKEVKISTEEKRFIENTSKIIVREIEKNYISVALMLLYLLVEVLQRVQ